MRNKIKNHLNEMSDALLDRAFNAAGERGRDELASEFKKWKNSPKRLWNRCSRVEYSIEDIFDLADEGNRCEYMTVDGEDIIRITPRGNDRYSIVISRNDDENPEVTYQTDNATSRAILTVFGIDEDFIFYLLS